MNLFITIHTVDQAEKVNTKQCPSSDNEQTAEIN